jgi:hypothetical protein
MAAEAAGRGTSPARGGSKRQAVKELLATLRKDDRDVDDRIFQSIHMVNLDTVIGYKKDGVEHSFLEGYDERFLSL